MFRPGVGHPTDRWRGQSSLFNRRHLLQSVAVGTVAWSWGPSGALQAGGFHATTPAKSPRAQSCILLYMDGGASQIDLWDLKPDAPDEIRGPWRPISTSVPGLQIGELLPRTAQCMDKVALVRSCRHAETVHDPAVYQMLTGWRHVSNAGGLVVDPHDAPHLGAAFGYLDRQAAVMPKVVELPETMRMEARVLPGQNAGFLGETWDPFRVGVTADGRVEKPNLTLNPALTRERLLRFNALLEQVNGRFCPLEPSEAQRNVDIWQRQALEIVARPAIDQAFDLSRESAAARDHYGRHRHGQSVLLARRLVEAGARFVTVYWGREDQDWADGRGPRPANNPWDTHRNHFPLVKDTLAPPADQALSALLEDLEQRGLLEQTLVVWMGDFGRTPRISRPWASRDHWPHAFSLLLAGAGLPRGMVLGATDRHAAEVVERPVSPADLTATIFTLLGLDPATSLPGPDGLPRPLSAGRPIEELL